MAGKRTIGATPDAPTTSECALAAPGDLLRSERTLVTAERSWSDWWWPAASTVLGFVCFLVAGTLDKGAKAVKARRLAVAGFAGGAQGSGPGGAPAGASDQAVEGEQ